MPNITLCGSCNRATRHGHFLCDICADDDERVRDEQRAAELQRLRLTLRAAGVDDAETQEEDRK